MQKIMWSNVLCEGQSSSVKIKKKKQQSKSLFFVPFQLSNLKIFEINRFLEYWLIQWKRITFIPVFNLNLMHSAEQTLGSEKLITVKGFL